MKKRVKDSGNAAPAEAHTALLGSRVGRALVAAAIVVMASWIVGPNMPGSPMRDQVDVLWSPAINAGFDQNWSVFSPNPRSQSLDVQAVVLFEDGTSTVWSVPDYDPIIGAYRGYRWRKWAERVRLDVNERYWASSAAWIARQHAIDGTLPIEVRLVRRWVDHEPLTTAGLIDSEPNGFEFFVWTRQ